MTPRRFDTPTPDLNGASILVTGGTGSFGRAFVKTVLERHQPARLAVLSRDELKQFEMQQEDPALVGYDCLRFFLGDVRDVNRLELAFKDVDVVVHAAALKQIPAAEYNPIECIKTNVHGAENVVMAAIRSGVERVVALSTDKAVNPANLYGASKLALDKIFVAANHLSGRGGTRFSVVRYGNVIGSRGSVVPLFRRLIESGAESLPITDPRMTRFWITLNQGVDFVLSSLAQTYGGEIFVPKLPSMKIVDIANCLAPDLPTHVTGIRVGEKLHELLIAADDARFTIELDDRFVIEPTDLDGNRLQRERNGACELDSGFHYASDGNGDWLNATRFMELLDGT